MFSSIELQISAVKKAVDGIQLGQFYLSQFRTVAVDEEAVAGKTTTLTVADEIDVVVKERSSSSQSLVSLSSEVNFKPETVTI